MSWSLLIWEKYRGACTVLTLHLILCYIVDIPFSVPAFILQCLGKEAQPRFKEHLHLFLLNTYSSAVFTSARWIQTLHPDIPMSWTVCLHFARDVFSLITSVITISNQCLSMAVDLVWGIHLKQLNTTAYFFLKLKWQILQWTNSLGQ